MIDDSMMIIQTKAVMQRNNCKPLNKTYKIIHNKNMRNYRKDGFQSRLK